MTTRSLSALLVTLAVTLVLFVTGNAYAQQLSISDVSQSETDAGTTNFTFTVTLDAPAGPSGVTFDIATADDTASSVSDYVTNALTGQTITAGNTSYIFTVVVNGDTTPEPNEGFFVNVTNVTGATVADGQGVGTILNDDITPIHDIQGPGALSPIVAATVIIRGVVTGVAANGFFVQADDADVDADPATSEGIFVLTGGTPPAAAAFTARVQVTGTVSEFVPSADPSDPSSTQIETPTVVQIAGPGQTLPTPVTLTSTFPDPGGPFDQLERIEHMRVSVPSLTVSGPSAGSVDEINGTGTSTGRFYGVRTGVARPFREAGIQPPDMPPSGTIPPIPRWDFNPERIRIESAAINGQLPLTVKSGDVVTSLVGPLDYRSRAYALFPDGTTVPAITPGTLPTTVAAPLGEDVTVASINLRRLFDVTDDGATSDTVLSVAAYNRRLAKASIAVRLHLRSPDIIGVQEVETLAVLSDLAARILADGGPTYAPSLVDGNDAAGLDVGFLVKTTPVAGGGPRVSVTSATQVGAATTWTDPTDGQVKLLNDRPPLVLDATVNRSATLNFPIVVVVADLLGLNGIDSATALGFTTLGDQVRQKRQRQAEFLANYLQGRQTAAPGERLVVIGSFNAFDVNDGYVDGIDVVAGTPVPDNETVVAGDGVDLVNPNLVNLASTALPAQRYSEVFEGNARNVDHVFVSAALIAATDARRVEHARIGADHPETHLGDPNTALRFSDRDPVVAYFTINSLVFTDLQITNVAAPNPAVVGQNLVYTITVTNAGPDAAATVSLSDTLPAGTTFVSLASPGGWSCTTPAVGAGGTVTCSNASMNVGSAVFTLTVAVATSYPSDTLSNTASVTTVTPDPDATNNSRAAVVAVNLAPSISDITDQTIAEDGSTGPLPVTIGDLATLPANLLLFASSSNQTIVPNGNIVLGGSGAVRTVTVAPAANQFGGPVIITVTVSDGVLSATDTFALTVNAVNDAPTIATIGNQSVNANAIFGPHVITIDDVDNPSGTLTISGHSSNQALVPDAAIAFGGFATNRTITIAPLLDQIGQTTITVTVNDGTVSTTGSFVLTVVPAPRTYFLAEGATGAFFDEDLMIANPNATDAPVTVTYFREGLTSLTETRTIPARSGVTLRLDSLPGLESVAVSVQVTSDNGLPLAVERTQFWDSTAYAGHTETAVQGPAPRWFFAEGSQGYFETFVLVANPQATPVDVTLTFLREGEPTVTTTMNVPAMSRKTIPAATIPDLVNRSFGVIVDATQPVVAERAMYFGSTPTRVWSGGGASTGATAPSSSWYFGEGATGTFFDTFILMMNPDVVDANVTLRYLLDTGEVVDVGKVVPARGRLTVNIETENDARLRAGAMSTLVTSDRPIVAERSVYWPTAEGVQPWGESHISQGATAAGPRWALAEGRTGGPLNFHTYIVLGNPGTEPVTVTAQFMPEGGGQPIVKTYVAAAQSRFTIDVTGEVPELQDRSFATLITTNGDRPIVVERSMYWDGAGLTWSGGSNAVATRMP